MQYTIKGLDETSACTFKVFSMDDRETGIVSSNGLPLEKKYSPRRHEEHEEGFRLASFIFVFFVPSWLIHCLIGPLCYPL
jgi:hypothetical protein